VFLPLGLYHGLNYLASLEPDSGRLAAPFDECCRAAFTYVHTNKPLSRGYLERLHRFGLRMVKGEARPEDAQRFAAHPAMLGWDVFDEPDNDGNLAAYPARFEAFGKFREGIRAHDPVRPIFVNTVAWIRAGHANRAWWIKWHQGGDLSCHDNYPIVHARTPTETLLDAQWGQSIPGTVALAVQSTSEQKPVWAILQAYRQLPWNRWRFPSPTESRCMAYAAVVHGATGLCWFSLDVDDVRRNAMGWGISPEPLPTFNTAVPVPGPLKGAFSDAQLDRRLRAALGLQPTADESWDPTPTDRRSHQGLQSLVRLQRKPCMPASLHGAQTVLPSASEGARAAIGPFPQPQAQAVPPTA